MKGNFPTGMMPLLRGYPRKVVDETDRPAIASLEICQKSWKHMGDVMPSNPDHRPVSAPLREVFYLNCPRASLCLEPQNLPRVSDKFTVDQS
jgi:hypothetical protein